MEDSKIQRAVDEGLVAMLNAEREIVLETAAQVAERYVLDQITNPRTSEILIGVGIAKAIRDSKTETKT